MDNGLTHFDKSGNASFYKIIYLQISVGIITDKSDLPKHFMMMYNLNVILTETKKENHYEKNIYFSCRPDACGIDRVYFYCLYFQ